MKIRNINAKISQRYYIFVGIGSLLSIISIVFMWLVIRESTVDTGSQVVHTNIPLENIREGGQLTLYGTLYKKRINQKDVYVIFADNNFKVLLTEINPQTFVIEQLGNDAKYTVKIDDFWNAIPRVTVQNIASISVD